METIVANIDVTTSILDMMPRVRSSGCGRFDQAIPASETSWSGKTFENVQCHENYTAFAEEPSKDPRIQRLGDIHVQLLFECALRGETFMTVI